MIYALSIDWLSIFCIYAGNGDVWQPIEGMGFSYKREDFGTRCFSVFHRVRIANDEGGVDEFAEVQSVPYSSLLPPYTIIIRFVNRFLYMPNFYELADKFMVLNSIACRSISRIDICADFNQFATIDPRGLIEGFAAKRLRHIGRGVGALYFNHLVKNGEYGVHYTGLSFGTHSSDAHVYLYNKSFELLTQGDKPWIKEKWKRLGLDIRNVWRLEVSIKSKGLRFKDKQTKAVREIGQDDIFDSDELDKVYHTFISKLFAFVKNRAGIKNISREPRIVLFDGRPAYDRGAISNSSPGNRMERILIRSLWQLADRYRGVGIYAAKDESRALAEALAASTGLYSWLEEKKTEWENQIHK